MSETHPISPPQKPIFHQELQNEKIKYESLLQSYVQLEKKYNQAMDVHKQYKNQAQRKLKKYQTNLDQLAKDLWEVKGNGMFSQNKINQTIQFCHSIIRSSPKNDYHTIGYGNIEEQIGFYEGNIFQWFKNNSTQIKTKSSPYDVLSLCYSFKQNYEEAEKWYTSKLGKNHDSYQLLLGLANIEYNNGKYEDAEKLYHRVIQLRPDLDKPYQQIAFIKCLKQNNKRQGRTWAEKAKGKSNQNHFAQYIFAITEESADTQIQKLTKLSETVKDYARIFNGLGNAYKNKKDYEDAVKWFKKAIQINPKYEAAFYGIGVIHHTKGQYEEALNWFHQSIKVNPKYDSAYFGLANTHSKKNENDEAIKWYMKCLQINPKNTTALNGLGMVYAVKQNFEQAKKWYNKCIEINPKYDFPYNGLGNVHYYKGEYDEAIDWFKKCIEINPKYAAPYNGLSNAYAKKGLNEQAKSWYDKKMAALKVD